MMNASAATAFATHFARLLSQRIREPDNVDAQNKSLGELVKANSETVALKWVDWHLSAGQQIFPPTTPEMLELISRMAAHGIRELTFDPKTDRVHLLGAIWILTSTSAVSDGGAGAMSQFRLLGAKTVHATSVVESATTGSGPTAIDSTPATFEVSARSMLDQLTDGLYPVEDLMLPEMATTAAPAAPGQVTTSPGRPPSNPAPPRIREPETAESLVSQFVNTTAMADIIKTLEAMATYCERRPKKLDDTVTILLALIAGESRLIVPDARRAFGVAMKRIGRSTILRSLVDQMATTPERRDDYMRIFTHFGDLAADEMVEALVTAESSKERRILFDGLLTLRRGIPTLIYLLSDGRWYVARNAAELLGELREVEAEPRLASLLTHSDARVRRSAAVALAKLQTPSAREALKAALSDESPDVRLAASQSLGADKDRESVEHVLRALIEEKDPDVQRTLFLALGRMGTRYAVEKLVEIAEPERIFKKKPTSLRVIAVLALAESNSSEAQAALRRFAEDRDAEVSAAAKRALTTPRNSTTSRREW